MTESNRSSNERASLLPQSQPVSIHEIERQRMATLAAYDSKVKECERLRAALERMLPAYKELYDFRFGKYDIESGIVEQAEVALGQRPADETSPVQSTEGE